MSEIAVTGRAMESFVIDGARPLNGRITAAGKKNGALPILAGCLLTDEPVTLTNVPRIRDVETMVGLLNHLGAETDWIGANEVRIHAADVATTEVDDELGRRRLDPHIHALAELGAQIDINGRYEMTTGGLSGQRIFLDEASVMATENAVMAASLAEREDR